MKGILTWTFLALIGLAPILATAGIVPTKVVLMTSLDPAKNRPPLRTKKWDINKKLEKIFRSKLKNTINETDLKVIHFATAEDLSRELSSSANKAVFWVSHSSGGKDEGPIDSSTIIDYRGYDLRDIFQAPSEKLQYLAFVGCKSAHLVNDFKRNGYLSNNPNLELYSRKKRQDARAGLRRALKQFKKSVKANLLKSRETACLESTKISVFARRKLPLLTKGQTIPSARVLLKGKFLGLFPKGNPGEVQEIKITMELPKTARDLKLVLDAGAPRTTPKGTIALGRLEIEELNYQIFASRTGIPFGNGRHVYRYKGSLELNQYYSKERALNCAKENK